MLPLTPSDFPLVAIGANVYRRDMSSPLFTAPDMAMANDLAFRLNSQEFAKYSPAQSNWTNVPPTITDWFVAMAIGRGVGT